MISEGKSWSDFIFADKKEASDFAYLLIMLHTCKHNKNLEDRSDINWFKKSTKEICPKTYEIYETEFKDKNQDPLLDMFNFIASSEFYTP